MKYIIFICLLGACANTHAYVVPVAKQAVQDDSNTVLAKQEEQYKLEQITSEEFKYESSLVRIENVFMQEGTQYHECIVASKKKTDCDELLKQLCTIDVYLDTKGGQYQKPYCK